MSAAVMGISVVHEGELAPPVDDVLAEQAEDLAIHAVRTVLANARGGIRSVEDILAYCVRHGDLAERGARDDANALRRVALGPGRYVGPFV